MKKALGMLLALAAIFFSAQAQDDVSLISTPQQLMAIRQNPSGNYALTADIDLKGFDWLPLPFSGKLDGAGHTIYNLEVSQTGLERAESVDGNRIRYDTAFAGLFSVVRDAEISNLNLLGADVTIDSGDSNFASLLAGFAENTSVIGCSVHGRVSLTQEGRMGGVAGLVGFGYGRFENNKVEAELVFIDANHKNKKTEEFLGGILACGYGDIKNNSVDVEGYASVYGFVHNGGVVGMYHVHHKEDKDIQGEVTGNSARAAIRFFERTDSRRAYCKAIVGEKLNRTVVIENNTTVDFKRIESKNYRVNLVPEVDENPDYLTDIISPTKEGFGYTMYTCKDCGYTYKGNFIPPLQ